MSELSDWSGHEFQVPDSIEKVFGYRTWRIAKDFGSSLWSTAFDLPWMPGVNTAICANHFPHPSPDISCGCGFWALKRERIFTRFHPQVLMILGRVALWGRIIEGTMGYRAQHAEITSVLILDNLDHYMGALVDKYRVPFRPVSEINNAVVDLMPKGEPTWRLENQEKN